MIFCNGDMHSVSLVKEALDEFKFLSGSSPSLEQSHVFFSGVDENVRRYILGGLGFKEGILPITYIRVPLITTKLKLLTIIPLLRGSLAELRFGLIGPSLMLVGFSLLDSFCFLCKCIGLLCSFFLKGRLRRFLKFSETSFGPVWR